MNKPDVVQLGAGYTKSAKVGPRTVFWGENVPPKVLGKEGLKPLTEGDWLHMRAAEDKRRARCQRNLRGLKHLIGETVEVIA